MTIADLEQLVREHLPDSGVCVQERGRAGVTTFSVTMLIDEHNRNECYELPGKPTALRKAGVLASWRYWEDRRICPICGKEFRREGSRRKYCTDACQQKAYRQRKKKKAAESAESD